MPNPAFRLSSIALLTTVALIAAACKSGAKGPRMRTHTAIESSALRLEPATANPGRSSVEIATSANAVKVTSNGIPSHQVGQFPNRGNPHQIKPQNVNVSVPTAPKLAAQPTELAFGWHFGVTVDGVPFDPLAAEFWQGDRRSGWNYNALGGAIPLGLDANYAHVQPTGSYHYHGIPHGLLKQLGWSPNAHSPLIGYAADGFPIYALNGSSNGTITEMTSSYRLKQGSRPGGSEPGGHYDGTFIQDYAFVESAGTLDRCNGAMTTNPDYPNGTYAYFLSNDFPVIPRCFAGTPDPSFQFRRRR